MSRRFATSQRTWFSLAGGLLAIWLIASPAAAQNTIHVPADQPTIQAAINAASAGDTVLVAPGTYAENVNFQGKAITLTSSGGASVTKIDGGAKGTVITFSNSEGANSVLNGFTIMNGFRNGSFGGGILISGASPTITANVITGNRAAGGIGIDVNGGSPLITGNTITANNQFGAGSSGQGGGGIFVSGSSTTPGNPQIIGNSITNNSVASGGNGGGISVMFFSSPLIQNNFIQGNSAYNNGGGISLQSQNSPVVAQNLIVNNSSLGGGSGGGIWVSPGSSAETILNNTIVANTAFDHTSGIFVTGAGQNAVFANNIVVAAPNQTAVTCNSTYSSIPPAFSNNDVLSTSGPTWAGICSTAIPPGNISADPLFLTTSDFHLQWGSPAVDAGTNSASGLPSNDFGGNPRIVDGNGDSTAIVDIGAYELSPTTITLAPSNLTFAAQPIGSTSTAQTVTLTNTGSQTLLLSIAIDPGFAQTNNCGTSLLAASSCSINVTFSPSAHGTLAGNLTLRSTAASNPHHVALVGSGGAPAVTLSSSSLDFGSQIVGTTSNAQIVTLSNSGDDIMAIAGITTTGDFAQTTTCGATLAVGASCSIRTTFTPAAAGVRNGFVNIADNAVGSPHQVSLGGSGFVSPVLAIATQPLSQTVGIGQMATFSVAASGGPALPLTYQWRKNNASIAGATSASYTTPPATIADDGATYVVSVTNGISGVTSNFVTLSVPHTAASIVTQPVSQTVGIGQTATFTVVGGGTGPLIYQWRKNNASIAGATSASYTTPPATVGDSGATYVVSVGNSFSGATSSVVTLSVPHIVASIVTQPAGQTVGIGQTATFAVVGGGTGPLTYQWRKNNASIAGATSASYTTPSATIADDGAKYVVSVGNSFSGATSSVVTLTVPHVPASITSQPLTLTVAAGETAKLTVAGAGTLPLIYQWRKNNSSIAGANSASYTTPPTTLADDGTQYVVSVSNSFSGATSNVVTLHIQPPGQWAWMGGATTINQAGVYGTLGVPAPANTPGGRQNPVTWTDASGNLWLFGGYGYDPFGNLLPQNDLWKYSAGQWTWMGGSKTAGQSGVYGTLGTASAGNIPGARFASVGWTDASGNFWLFGGIGFDSTGTEGDLNDLWKYSSGQWTWMSGSNLALQHGTYGTQGVPAAGNTPGGRVWATSWTDASGVFWLFGGSGYDASSSIVGELNDLWKYSGGQWTWVSGSNTMNQSGAYGTQGIAATGNVPGGRFNAVGWTDSSGELWLFGGCGYDSTVNSTVLNDLWRFDGTNWTWMSGLNLPGYPYNSNVPGVRQWATGWTDKLGNFWLFGGANSGYSNDLWRYSGGQWTWVSGQQTPNQNSTFGTQGVLGLNNAPGSRISSGSWVDAQGNLWLFGGYGTASGSSGNLGDLWKYVP